MRLDKSEFVDVLIISYNQEQFIAEAIESVLNQTYENINIFIADDCSKDRTREIILDYKLKYPSKITEVFNKTNLGITGNSNAGLAYCKSNFFVIMGGDDVLCPNKISRQIEWFSENPKGILCGHKLNLINQNSQIIGSFLDCPDSGYGFDNWIKKGMLFGCMSIMIKRNLGVYFDENLKYSSDYKFFIQTIGFTGQYGYINSSLGWYRKHDNNITSTNFQKCNLDWFLTYNSLLIAYPSIEKVIKKGISNHYYRVALLEVNYRCKQEKLWKSVKSDILNYKSWIRLIVSLLTFK